jgi:PAS domain S-box-containing protein
MTDSSRVDVLVVDDREENLMAMEAVLADLDVNTITAGSGLEALGLVLKHDFALILLDVQMPEMDGFETAELLRSRQKTQRIPIIFVTAISKEERHVFKGYEAGAVDYLFKPIDPVVLKSKVRVFTDLHRQRQELEATSRELEQTVALLQVSDEELRKSEEQIRLISDNLPVLISHIDAEGRIIFNNRTFEDWFGVARSEVLGRPAGEVWRELGCPELDEHLEVARSGQAVTFETALASAGDRQVQVTFAPHLATGEAAMGESAEAVRGVFVLVSDITERKQAEEALRTMNQQLDRLVEERTRELERKARELEEANIQLKELDRMKSAFLSSVSHELRTPLTSIMGFAKLTGKEFQRHFQPMAGDDEQLQRKGGRIQENLEVIAFEGERLTRLINDVLDLSKIESGRMEWRDAELEPEELIRRAVKAVSGQFDQKPGVELRQDVAPDLPKLYADPDRMLQVFINLLNNAGKFTSEGRVAIRAESVSDGWLRIQVQDTGEGISLEDQDLVFDKFHQVTCDDTLRDKPEGTGLGLAICRQIVEHYGGRIYADSEPGQGSVFTVEMPGRRDAVGEAASADET